MNGPRILVSIKQVSQADTTEFDPSGVMIRHPEEQELNPFCRRAVTFGVELARSHSGTCSVVSMGPPSAAEILREALAIGADEAYLLSDPSFAGADTLVTAEVLEHFIRTRELAYDLILTGRFAIDANTGLVGAQLAELLGMPFAGAAKQLEWVANSLLLSTELDDGIRSVQVKLPAVIAVAERICTPAKPSAEEIAAIPTENVQRLDRNDLHFSVDKPKSRTTVDEIQHESLQRLNIVVDGSHELDKALAFLADQHHRTTPSNLVPAITTLPMQHAAYLCDPEQPDLNRHFVSYLLSGDQSNACQLCVLHTESDIAGVSKSFPGVDHLVRLKGSSMEDDLVPVIADWLRAHPQELLVAPATSFGREIGARLGVLLDAGVLTDLTRLEIDHLPQITGWKTVGSVASVAKVSSTTAMGIVLLRPGVPTHASRLRPSTPSQTTLVVPERGRVVLTDPPVPDPIFNFANAPIIFGVGAGVNAYEIDDVFRLAQSVKAELGCTRKIADRGLMPRSRQIGITGRSVSPALYIGIGTRGSHNHLAGVRGASTIVNLTLESAVGDTGVDLTVIGDWHDTLPPIVEYLRSITDNAACKQPEDPLLH